MVNKGDTEEERGQIGIHIDETKTAPLYKSAS